MNRLVIFEQYLLNKYPSIYQLNSKIECKSGWFALIDVFSEKLVFHSKKAYVTVAKESYGHLSLEVEGYLPEDYYYIFGLTNMAYSLSELICEQCGSRGLLFNCPGIIQPRCDIHGGLPLNLSRPEIAPNLPFSLGNIGVAWSEMISNFYLQILMHIRENQMPMVSIKKIKKKNNKLVIEFVGGDETTLGMVDLLVAYTYLTDENTGDLIH
ncbi:MAG: hypothetical protein RIQ94_745 [Pseudomonadota bacterium]